MGFINVLAENTHTGTVLTKIINEIKRFLLVFTLCTQIFYVAYLVYAIVTGKGNTYVNIALIAVTLVYSTVYLVSQWNEDKRLKRLRSKTKHVLNWSKILVKTLDIGVILYSIVISADSFTPFSAIFTVLSIISWVVQLVFELAVMYVESRYHLVVDAFKKDIEETKRNPIRKIGGIIFGNEDNANTVVDTVTDAGSAFAYATGHPIVAGAVAATGEVVKRVSHSLRKKDKPELSNADASNEGSPEKKPTLFEKVRSKLLPERTKKSEKEVPASSAQTESDSPERETVKK